MQVNIYTLIISVVTFVISAAVTFYIKDYLQKRSEYGKLRKKLEKIAGKHASVLYSPGPGASIGIGPQIFKIIDIDQHGITLQNELQTIFIPPAKVIQSEMILPCDDFENAKLSKMKKDFEDIAEAMFPAMFEKMFPAMMDAIKNQVVEEEGEIGFAIGVKIQKILQDEGYQIKKIEGKE